MHLRQEIMNLRHKLQLQNHKKPQRKKVMHRLSQKYGPNLLGKIQSFADIACLDVQMLHELAVREGMVQASQLMRIVEPAQEICKLVGMTEAKDRLFQLLIATLAQQMSTKGQLMLLPSPPAPIVQKPAVRWIFDYPLEGPPPPPPPPRAYQKRCCPPSPPEAPPAVPPYPAHTSLLPNIVLTGPPGVGKSSLCKQIAKLFHAAGILRLGHVVFATRKDLIGRFLGHTADKTTAIVNKALGGILVIDEVYSLGCAEAGNSDSFAREAIDTLNQLISEHENDLLVVIAGYEDEIEQRFFAQNRGLRSRFPEKIQIPTYDEAQLREILLHQVVQNKAITTQLQGSNVLDLLKGPDKFKYQGRDMSTLAKATITKALDRMWREPCVDVKEFGSINPSLADLEAAVSQLMGTREDKKSEERSMLDMYT
jgi:hypothetical protein